LPLQFAQRTRSDDSHASTAQERHAVCYLLSSSRRAPGRHCRSGRRRPKRCLDALVSISNLNQYHFGFVMVAWCTTTVSSNTETPPNASEVVSRFARPVDEKMRQTRFLKIPDQNSPSLDGARRCSCTGHSTVEVPRLLCQRLPAIRSHGFQTRRKRGDDRVQPARRRGQVWLATRNFKLTRARFGQLVPGRRKYFHGTYTRGIMTSNFKVKGTFARQTRAAVDGGSCARKVSLRLHLGCDMEQG